MTYLSAVNHAYGSNARNHYDISGSIKKNYNSVRSSYSKTDNSTLTSNSTDYGLPKKDAVNYSRQFVPLYDEPLKRKELAYKILYSAPKISYSSPGKYGGKYSALTGSISGKYGGISAAGKGGGSKGVGGKGR